MNFITEQIVNEHSQKVAEALNSSWDITAVAFVKGKRVDIDAEEAMYLQQLGYFEAMIVTGNIEHRISLVRCYASAAIEAEYIQSALEERQLTL